MSEALNAHDVTHEYETVSEWSRSEREEEGDLLCYERTVQETNHDENETQEFTEVVLVEPDYDQTRVVILDRIPENAPIVDGVLIEEEWFSYEQDAISHALDYILDH